MKCTIPEISWHNREPVLSVDISPISSDVYKLATGGGDSHVLIWQLAVGDNGAIKQEIISDLTRHQRAVNAVRWSPSGEYLASADDDANIIVWQQKTDNIPLLEGDTGDKEIWIVSKVLRGHKEDIYDICWSVNELKMFSGSIDNTAIIWDFSKGKMEHILSEHKGFVQGVAWDPKDQVIVSISTDRICRIFDVNGRHMKARLYRGCLPVPNTHYLYEKSVKYFHDDTFKSFFRRLQFSPDGSLLIVPSGHMETEDCKRTLNGTLIFSMSSSSTEPVAILPLPKQCSTVVRCCPILFELRKDGPNPIINLPYRIIVAIGTDHDIILYDTQQLIPFARFQEVHYTRLTDLTWSKDGLVLVASSTDGFCSLITFDVTELGVPYVKHGNEVEDCMDVSGCEELDVDENVDINNKSNEVKNKETTVKKRSSFLEEWALKTPKKIKLDRERREKEKKTSDEVIEIIDDDDDVKELSKEIKDEINKLIPSKASQSMENKESKSSTDVKPIEVRRKPRIHGAITSQSTSCENDKFSHPDSKSVKLDADSAKENQAKKNCIDLSIVIEDCAKEDKTMKKMCKSSAEKPKGETPKTKVTPIKKKVTNKKNPLLNFLKNPSKKRGDANVSKSSSSVPLIDITLNEEEAQDAWKCKNDVKNCETELNSGANVSQVEDSTEDFCLQLEDSQVETNLTYQKTDDVTLDKTSDGTNKEIENTVKAASGSSVSDEKNECETNATHQCTDDVTLDKTKDTNKETANTAKVTTSSSLPDDNKDCDRIKTVNPQQKVPRRVALITLSSPKGKKKEKPSEKS